MFTVKAKANVNVKDLVPLTVAVLNEKGGVGKTTTVLNLGHELAFRGLNVLLLDLDHRADLTKGSGVALADGQPSILDALSENPPDFATCAVPVPGDTRGSLSVVGAERDLAVLELDLAGLSPFDRPGRLRPLLEWGRANYHCVLLDAPPGLGVLTSMILGSVDTLLVPQEPSFLAASGVRELELTLREFASVGVGVGVLGILITKVRSTTHHRDYMEMIRARYGKLVFDTFIPESVRYQEAPAFGMSIREYLGGRGPLVEAYSRLADEVMVRWQDDEARSMPLPQ
jgi:chromosome partitioning protein